MRRFLWEGSVQRVKTTSSKELLEFQIGAPLLLKTAQRLLGLRSEVTALCRLWVSFYVINVTNTYSLDLIQDSNLDCVTLMIKTSYPRHGGGMSSEAYLFNKPDVGIWRAGGVNIGCLPSQLR